VGNTPNESQDDDDQSFIDVHAGNVAEIIHKKNIATVYTEDARDHMSSRHKDRNKHKRINMISSRRCDFSVNRNIALTKKLQHHLNDPTREYRAELDRRADTCCVGMGFMVVEYSGQTCNVYPYNPTYKPKKGVPIVKAITAFDDELGDTIILCLNQVLYFGKELEQSLLNPNQMRWNGLIVDDCPVSLSHDGKSSHSIKVHDKNAHIPLRLHGCISCTPICLPTQEEMETCTWLNMTSEEEWKPYSEEFEEKENEVKSMINSITTISSPPTLDEQIFSQISAAYSMPHILKSNTMSVKSTTKQNAVDATTLSKRWFISSTQAEQVLSTKAQKFIRSSVNLLERRYRTNIQQLKYKYLPEPHGGFYSDTMFSSMKSTNGHPCGLGFFHFTPMNKESGASITLIEFIQHIGIPSRIHSDGSKVQSKGNWAKVIKSHHIKQSFTEPHTPWQNRAEGAIKELKRHTSSLM